MELDVASPNASLDLEERDPLHYEPFRFIKRPSLLDWTGLRSPWLRLSTDRDIGRCDWPQPFGDLHARYKNRLWMAQLLELQLAGSWLPAFAKYQQTSRLTHSLKFT